MRRHRARTVSRSCRDPRRPAAGSPRPCPARIRRRRRCRLPCCRDLWRDVVLFVSTSWARACGSVSSRGSVGRVVQSGPSAATRATQAMGSRPGRHRGRARDRGRERLRSAAPNDLPLVAIGCLIRHSSSGTRPRPSTRSPRSRSVRRGRDRALGRVSSTFHVAAGVAQLAATLVAGLLAALIGLRTTMWLAPFGLRCRVDPVALTRPRLRELPEPRRRRRLDSIPSRSRWMRATGAWTGTERTGDQANSAATNASGSNGMRSPTASPTPTKRTGTSERVLDGEDDPALRRGIELGQHDAGQRRRPRGTPAPGRGRSGRSSRRGRRSSPARRRAAACR